jgi:hypothetical protein
VKTSYKDYLTVQDDGILKHINYLMNKNLGVLFLLFVVSFYVFTVYLIKLNVAQTTWYDYDRMTNKS